MPGGRRDAQAREGFVERDLALRQADDRLEMDLQPLAERGEDLGFRPRRHGGLRHEGAARRRRGLARQDRIGLRDRSATGSGRACTAAACAVGAAEDQDGAVWGACAGTAREGADIGRRPEPARRAAARRAPSAACAAARDAIVIGAAGIGAGAGGTGAGCAAWVTCAAWATGAAWTGGAVKAGVGDAAAGVAGRFRPSGGSGPRPGPPPPPRARARCRREGRSRP